MKPEVKGTQTEKNLQAALSGESIARNKYTYYAMAAKKAGDLEVAEMFERLARNEMMHAKKWFEYLNPIHEQSKENVKDAAQGEYMEWHSMYPEFAKIADEEGFHDIADMFRRVANIENDHEKQFMMMYSKLISQGLQNVEPEEETTPTTKQVAGYRCQFCGAVYENRPDACPVCGAIGSYDACMFTVNI